MPHKDPKTRADRQKAYAKTYYEKNKAQITAASKTSAKEYKDKWRRFKATLKCVQCGQDHPATFDFHHVDSTTKEASVSKLIKNRAFKRAMEEVKKCVVLCANCHRIYHHNERIPRRAKKKKGGSGP